MSKVAKKILIVTIILTLIGLYQVYSSSKVWALYKEGDQYFYFKRQLIFTIIGYFCFKSTNDELLLIT